MADKSVRKNLLDYLRNTGSVQCVLSIDLGNSRTAMALIDRVNDPVHPPIIHSDVLLKWDRAGNSIKTLKGPHASRISLVMPHDNGLSFLRIGEHAVHNEHVFRGKRIIGTHSVSSPKRYFTDSRLTRTPWKAAEYGKPSEPVLVADFSGSFPVALAVRYGTSDAKYLPRSAMLGGMVAELYEQAHVHANSDEFKLATNDDRSRFVSHIHLTYPTTFTIDEKNRYRLQVDKVMRTYFLQKEGFAEAPFAEVICEIDEGSAVLAHYAESALAESGGTANAWLSTIGRLTIDSSRYEARVAVIDIGGGTSDLSIANLTQTTGNPNGVDVQLLFLDGINRAGDDFLAELVKDWFLPSFVKMIKPQDAGPENFEKFRVTYNAWISNHLQFIRTICSWVFNVFNAIERGSSTVSITIIPEDRKPLSELFNFGDSHDWPATGYELKIDKEDICMFQGKAHRFFLPVIDRMAQEIAALDCDFLILSGKMCELPTVRRLIAELIPVPPFSTLAASELVGGEHGGDVKFATVLGGAQLALQKIGASNARSSIRFLIGQALTGKYEWGFTSDVSKVVPRISDKLGNRLAPDQQTGWLNVSIGNQNLYILRQRTGNLGAVTVSHVLRKADIHRTIERCAIVQIKVHENGRLTIMAVHGCASDGTQLMLDDFVLEPHGHNIVVHWLDHGRI